jgi:hypothetical protein
MEAVLAHFMVLSWHLPGGTEENLEKLKSGLPAWGAYKMHNDHFGILGVDETKVFKQIFKKLDVQVCMDQNFRILPSLAQVWSLPSNMLPVPNQSPTFLYSSPNESLSLYNLPLLSSFS